MSSICWIQILCAENVIQKMGKRIQNLGSGGVLVGLYSVSKNEKKKEKKEKEKKEKNKKKGGKKGIESKIRLKKLETKIGKN